MNTINKTGEIGLGVFIARRTLYIPVVVLSNGHSDTQSKKQKNKQTNKQTNKTKTDINTPRNGWRCGVLINSKHWFTTSYLQLWRKVPDSGAGSVGCSVR